MNVTRHVVHLCHMDSSSPAGLFDSYDQDFKHIIRGIREKLEGSGKPDRGGRPLLSTLKLVFFFMTRPRRTTKGGLAPSRD